MYVLSFFLWRCGPTRAMASFMRFLDHTQRRITVGRTPLDEWSASRIDPYLTTHNTHNKLPCPGGIRTHDLSRRATADLRLSPRGHWDRQYACTAGLFFRKKKNGHLCEHGVSSHNWYFLPTTQILSKIQIITTCGVFHFVRYFCNRVIWVYVSEFFFFLTWVHRKWGTAVTQWLRCCATNRKVAGSMPAGVIDIKSFRSHYGPGVAWVFNRNEYQEHFLGVKEAGA